MNKEGKIKIPRVTLTCHIDFVLLDEGSLERRKIARPS